MLALHFFIGKYCWLPGAGSDILTLLKQLEPVDMPNPKRCRRVKRKTGLNFFLTW